MSPAADAASRLVFTADLVSVRGALARLLDTLPMRGLGEANRGRVELVLAEVLNNVAEHAYAGGSGPVEVALATTPRGIACQVIDRGLAMPADRPPEGLLPAIGANLPDDLPEGGFGWFLIRSLTADLTYARSAGQNRLSFVIPLNDVA
jgi:serine/threonine-protein kinase RsbW